MTHPMLTEEMVEAARTAWLESAADYTRLDVSIRAALSAALPLIGEAFAKVADGIQRKMKDGEDCDFGAGIAATAIRSATQENANG